MNPNTIPAVFLLDLILGDPNLFHPIRGVGRIVTLAERLLYPANRNGRTEFIAGSLLCFLVTATCAAAVWGVRLLCGSISPEAATAADIVTGFYCISAKSLVGASEKVRKNLICLDLKSARRSLSMIVGRDTDALGRRQIVKAAVETVAENITDGIVSPLFFFALGGPIAAVAFKAVSTMDSMIGYKNDRYRHFGTCAARLDDILNYIPARLTAFLFIPLAALLSGQSWRQSLYIASRDGNRHESPNSGKSEAAMAGALGIELGGKAYYKGVAHIRHHIGDCRKTCGPQDILRANRIALIVAALATVTLFLARTALYK